MQGQAPSGALAPEFDRSDFHFVVHQASGMVSEQLRVSAGEALLRLRAHAFANDRPLNAVAEDVIARRLRLM
jgi:hypothetical protein